jgi:hypothetical protein
MFNHMHSYLLRINEQFIPVFMLTSEYSCKRKNGNEKKARIKTA